MGFDFLKRLVTLLLYDTEDTKALTSDLPSDGHGPVKDAVHAQDGRLRRVDDGSAEHGAEHSSVADGEGAAVHVLHSQLVLTSLQ